MANLLFVSGILIFYIAVFFFGFKYLPKERWQIIACVPLYKTQAGTWQGLNLTYYGFFNAMACAAALLLIFILLGSAGILFTGVLSLLVLVLGICVPAASIIARLVEGKKHTFSIGGASFVGILLAPWAIVLTDRFLGQSMDFSLPLYPVLAAFSIAYAAGEATGRLACISYGCCYGKPLSQSGILLNRLFERHHFVFTGKIKKIAYASRMDGVKVIPVQAVTSIIFILAALTGIVLYLRGYYFPAFLVPLAVTQVWRFLSEFLRADFRGGHEISPYQIMSAISLIYASSLTLYLPPMETVTVDIIRGISSLWNPAVILTLEAVVIIIFLHTGRSGITFSSLELHVNEERI